MNPELKKEEKHSNRQAKYMERHVTLCVTLDKEKDADIIGWLDMQDNRSQAVRSVIKDFIKFDGLYEEHIDEKDNESKDTVSDGDQETGSSEEADEIEIFEI